MKMNRLEEFLQNLDIKNKIMLYISIVVIGIIIFYNFNYNVLSGEIEENKQLINDLQNRVKFSLKRYNNRLVKLKKEYKKLKINENKKLQDLDYLNKRLDISTLNVSDKNFYTLLENILYKSNMLNLAPSFYIKQNFGKFKKYIIDINGTLGYCQEKNLFKFIKILESYKYVNNIDKLILDENSSNYYIKYSIWGIK